MSLLAAAVHGTDETEITPNPNMLLRNFLALRAPTSTARYFSSCGAACGHIPIRAAVCRDSSKCVASSGSWQRFLSLWDSEWPQPLAAMMHPKLYLHLQTTEHGKSASRRAARRRGLDSYGGDGFVITQCHAFHDCAQLQSNRRYLPSKSTFRPPSPSCSATKALV